jgi:hypothetical protein
MIITFWVGGTAGHSRPAAPRFLFDWVDYWAAVTVAEIRKITLASSAASSSRR